MNPIPKPIIVNTGEQERVSKTIDDFFIETKQYLESRYSTKPENFEIKSGEISYNSTQIGDDRITYLAYEERVLASVLETRTEFNRILFTFFRNLDGLDNSYSE